jgi:hypothetical protein
VALPEPRREARRFEMHLAHRSHDERPGQLGGRRRGRAFRRHRNAARRAGREIDVVGGTSGLADELEPRQAREQRGADRRALAHEQHRVGIGDTLGDRVERGDGVVVDLDIEVCGQRRIAVQRADAVLVIVGNDYFHVFPREPQIFDHGADITSWFSCC